MPRYYCDYCDTYLTHDSPSVRKQHNAGYKHKGNVRSYYQHFEEQQTQILIDKRIKEHLWQAAPFQHQVGATFNQHLISLQSNQQRPRLPVLVPPNLPAGASSQAPVPSPFLPGVRPPVLPHLAAGFPGYGAFPSGQPSGPPPGAPSMQMQMNSLPRPPMLTPATWAAAPPTSSSAATLFGPAMYQANSSSAATIGAFNPPTAPGFQTAAPAAPTVAASTASQDGVSYAPASETNR